MEPEPKRARTDDAEALLVGPARADELRYQDLSAKDKKACDAAMAKEWAKWEQFGSTRKITRSEWEEAVRQKVNVTSGTISSKARKGLKGNETAMVLWES